MRLKTLPSTDLLRSFEAAARHLSFTKASAELFVTQSAVSRQIKTLEEQLNVRLFLRDIRKLDLTEAGRLLYQSVDIVLKQLEATTARLVTADQSRTLGISTKVSFSALWLIPRLGRFRSLCPLVDVRVSATSEVQNIKRKRLDMAIRYARPERVPAGARILFQEEVFAVCSHSLLGDASRPLREPADLSQHVLLHMDDSCGDWPWYTWSYRLEEIGLPQLRPAGAIRFSQYDQMIQVCIDGQGVALGRQPLVGRLLAQQRLVAPFKAVQ